MVLRASFRRCAVTCISCSCGWAAELPAADALAFGGRRIALIRLRRNNDRKE